MLKSSACCYRDYQDPNVSPFQDCLIASNQRKESCCILCFSHKKAGLQGCQTKSKQDFRNRKSIFVGISVRVKHLYCFSRDNTSTNTAYSELKQSLCLSDKTIGCSAFPMGGWMQKPQLDLFTLVSSTPGLRDIWQETNSSVLPRSLCFKDSDSSTVKGAQLALHRWQWT